MVQNASSGARSNREGFPSPAALGLTGPHAADDIAELGWNQPESTSLLWLLSDVGDPELALNSLYRLVQAVGEEKSELLEAIETNPVVAVRLLALLGGSAALGDHLVANHELWHHLTDPLPTAQEMLQQLLGCVDATPVDGDDTATADLSTAGLYRAALTGNDADRALRTTYRSLLLRIAAIDLAGTLPLRRDDVIERYRQPEVDFPDVSEALADLADAALTAALAVAVGTVYGPDEPVTTKLAVIAMGKCGARELNYISDVDVIFVAEPADTKATRVAADFIKTGCRCFFEVDAALRPEGKSGALVRTLDSHITYYKRWAETWEFQALLKARPMTGTMELGKRYKEALDPMVWQACERDSFVDNVQAMRRRVIENVPKDLKPRELKLGTGGLRDVEFAVQLLQMVHGRHDDTLRVMPTVKALAALVEGGFIGRDDGDAMIRAYSFVRLLEHRLQLQRMKRTHLLPPEDDIEARRWLARACGFTPGSTADSQQELRAAVRATGRLIATLHKKLFYRPLLNSIVNLDVGTVALSPESARRQLSVLGYTFPDRAYEHLSALASGTSRRARIQAMLLPTLMEWLSETSDPDAGLLAYRRLSETAHDRQWFLRMLRDEGVVGKRLMRILGTSPYATDLLLATPDTVKLLGDGAEKPRLLAVDPDTVSKSIVSAARRHKDPNKAIAAARSLRRAELARIACADILGLLTLEDVCDSLSKVWDAVLESALEAEIRGWQVQHEQETAPAKISVIGMGRLGGAELGYGSDADVMMVCEAVDPEAESAAVKWAITIVDSMRRRLAKPSVDPPLEVDLDLRPEGRSGATVRTLGSYETYYQRWGETWEVQALLRATWIAGDADLGRRFLQMIDQFRYPEGGVSEETVRQVRRMKARVDSERLPRGADRSTHTKLGRGALTDIEWTVQLLTLQHAHNYPDLHNTSTLECLDAIRANELIPAEDVDILREAWLTATKARNALVLVRGKRTDQLPQPGSQLAHVAGAAGWDPEDYQSFLENYLRVTRRARKVVDRVFWGEEDTFEP